jgi:hypothetical protein
MAEKKLKKNGKKTGSEETPEKNETEGAEEETTTGEGNISEGVLDAFDDEGAGSEVEGDDEFSTEDSEDDEFDSGDFRMRDEW